MKDIQEEWDDIGWEEKYIQTGVFLPQKCIEMYINHIKVSIGPGMVAMIFI
jgi:hypothetical protein